MPAQRQTYFEARTNSVGTSMKYEYALQSSTAKEYLKSTY